MATGGKGKELERLVAALERALAGSEARIEAPSRRLIDRDTGKPREHDVLITWDRGHHQIVTALECRNRNRPVGVPDVEAFADKCEATGVHHGVIVSATGFRMTARQKAAKRAISCMDMAEAEAFDWLGIDHIVGFERQFHDWHITVMFSEPPPSTLTTIFDDQGRAVTQDELCVRIMNSVPKTDEPELEIGRDRKLRLHVLTPGWTALVDGEANRPIDHVLADVTVTTVKTQTPIQRHTYSGEGHRYSVASADIPINGREGRIVMVEDHSDAEGGTNIYWVPDRPIQGA